MSVYEINGIHPRFPDLRAAWQHRALALALTRRNIKARYMQTLLERAPWPADYRTAEPVILLKLTRVGLESCLAGNPDPRGFLETLHPCDSLATLPQPLRYRRHVELKRTFEPQVISVPFRPRSLQQEVARSLPCL